MRNLLLCLWLFSAWDGLYWFYDLAEAQTVSPSPSPDFYKPLRRKMPIKKKMPSPQPIPSPIGKVPLLIVPTPNPSPDSDE